MARLFSRPLRFLQPRRDERIEERPSGVLLVCTGNICRSPMAEALLRGLLTRRAPDTRVESAGLAAVVGHPADPFAVELMSERSLDITPHRARQLTARMVEEFPIVLVMDGAQLELAHARHRSARARIHRLGAWSDFDVPDPVGCERLEFERALVLIDQGIAEWVERLWPAAART